MNGHPYRHAVCIGAFQPFHGGHRSALRRGLELADDLVVVIGSADRPRTPRYPWTAAEREAMVRAALGAAEAAQVRFVRQWDYHYDDGPWAGEVQAKVAGAVAGLGGGGPVALLGPAGEAGAWRRRLFPQWAFEPVHREGGLTGAGIRDAYLSGRAPLSGAEPAWAAHVPGGVRDMLRRWEGTPEYQALADEWNELARYRARWSAVPFPVVFTTVDALVVKSGHALLVRRGHNPGKDLLALPGGFLDAEGDRSLRAGALRELREETGIDVPAEVLARSIVAERAFDHPERSLRGRTITHAVCIDLGHGPLPRVRGGDDAREALWVPLADLRRRPWELFEDHFDIIACLVGGVG
jgi:bifunctional NMN adenylyltransferase/nudix hydrolase